MVQHNVPAAALLQSVRNAVGESLVDVRLFDVYVGEGIDSNEKSLAIGLTLQSQTPHYPKKNKRTGRFCFAGNGYGSCSEATLRADQRFVERRFT